MKDFRRLDVWARSHQLTLTIYEVTRTFPKEELFGLTSQIRRASSSVAANIAEGCGRGTNSDFQRFLQIAYGSISEVDYHWLLARDLDLIDERRYREGEKRINEIKKMLGSLIRKINFEK